MPGRWRPPFPSDLIRVVLVESRALLGIGVRKVLDQEPGIEVVAQVSSADDALRIVNEAAPDVILVNVPPDEAVSGESARRLHEETPESALVILGGEDDDAAIVEALEIGATGHVPELAGPRDLVATIRAVAEGENPLRTELAGRPDLHDRIVADVRQLMMAEAAAINPLSPRELEVLRLVADGLCNRDIAEAIAITEQTVKNHLTSIFHKLGVPNRTTAVIYAVRQGWLELAEVGAPVGASDRDQPVH